MDVDLVKRLREAAKCDGDKPWWWDCDDRGGPANLLNEAAEHIENLGLIQPKIPSNKFMDEAKPILFNILVNIASTLSAYLTKDQIIQVMRETVDELDRRD